MDELLKHLQAHHCLPFPAGPVIPRRDTKLNGSTRLKPSNHQRAKAGLALIAAEMRRKVDAAAGAEAARDRPNPKSPLTRLLEQSLLEWASRHAGSSLLGPMEEESTAVPLLAALHHLADAKGALMAERIALNAASDGTNELIARMNHMQGRGDQSPLRSLAYRAPQYGCTCQQALQPDAPEPSEHRFIQQVLDLPEGEHLLLGLFFLKQLHSHLAWAPHRQWHPDSINLYGPVLAVLHAQAEANDAGAYSPTAAALLRGLPRLHPYFANKAMGVGLSALRPNCFWPGLLDEHDAALAEACSLLASYGDLADMAQDADHLAREVAAQLTDPILAKRIGMNSRALSYIASALVKHGKSLKQFVKGGVSNGNPASWIDLDFARDHLQHRLTRLISYSNWMHALDGPTVAAQGLAGAQP